MISVAVVYDRYVINWRPVITYSISSDEGLLVQKCEIWSLVVPELFDNLHVAKADLELNKA